MIESEAKDSRAPSDPFTRLLTSLRDACSLALEAIDEYLAIAELFPMELRCRLDVSLKDDKWIIMPHGYLGSRNFKRIAEIVRQHGGEYKPSGKDSHFVLPKNAIKVKRS